MRNALRFAIIGALTLAMTGFAGVSHAAGYVSFHNAGSGTGCMDLRTYDTFTPAILWGCHGGSSQLWIRRSDATISNLGASDKCLDVSSYTTGAVVHLYPCSGVPSQKWNHNSWGRLSNTGSNNIYCMDLTSYNEGTPLTLFPCQEVLSQRWIAALP